MTNLNKITFIFLTVERCRLWLLRSRLVWRSGLMWLVCAWYSYEYPICHPSYITPWHPVDLMYWYIVLLLIFPLAAQCTSSPKWNKISLAMSGRWTVDTGQSKYLEMNSPFVWVRLQESRMSLNKLLGHDTDAVFYPESDGIYLHRQRDKKFLEMMSCRMMERISVCLTDIVCTSIFLYVQPSPGVWRTS